jgi:hypothetical protein
MTFGHLGPKTSDNKDVVSMWPTEGTRKTFISHNWCDKTTWTSSAVRVVDEVADVEVPGVYTTYALDQQYIVDTYHGKISGEDFLKDDSGNSFRVVIKVNDVTKVEQDPHTSSGGDYTVNYIAGKVTFLSALVAADVVKVTYHYATAGSFIIKPSPGKKLKIKRAEVQFSSDIVIKDTVKFQAYGLVDVFAPQLTPSPYPSGTLIPIGEATVYKTMMDYINEANGAYPDIPALGFINNPVTDWRNTNKDIITFPWDYLAMTELSSAAGMEIRVTLDHNLVFGGMVATATFYCLSENE